MFPTMKTNREESSIPTAAGHLEAVYTGNADATRAIVLCHPHPQYGGNLHDAVVETLDGAARRHGFATLKFNFRGVGDSTGHFDNGVGEVDDLLSALAWLRDRVGPMPCGLRAIRSVRTSSGGRRNTLAIWRESRSSHHR